MWSVGASVQGSIVAGYVRPGGSRRMTLPMSVASRTSRLWREVADRVFFRRYPDFAVNVGLVLGSEMALVIDTRGSERQGRLLLDEIHRITGLPIAVAITHHHYDHCFGNAAFSPADIWSHERCVIRMRDQAEIARQALATAMPELDHEYSETPIVLPNKTVKTGAAIELGGRRVDLIHLGRGHTDNDLVMSVPDARVVFAGDLVEQGGPPSFEDSFPMEWPGTLGRLLEMVQGPVVPGHGDVVRRSFVEGQLADMTALSQLATRVRFDGGSANDAMPLAPFPSKIAKVALQRAFAQLAGEI